MSSYSITIALTTLGTNNHFNGRPFSPVRTGGNACYRFSAEFDHSLETRTSFIFFPSFLDRVPLDDRLVTRLRLFVKFVPVWEDKRNVCVLQIMTM